MLCRSLSALAAVQLAACSASAQGTREFDTSAGRMRLATVAEGLESPWGMAFLPDGRMLVTERAGRVRIVGRDGRLSAPLAGVPAVHEHGQGGLLDVALHPDFKTTRLVYLSYSEQEADRTGTVVARGKLGEAGLEEVRVIFRQTPKLDGGAHFGSRLVFARDGRLFVTLGDRGERDRAQRLGEHVGKVIRINADGSVPADNPFVGRPEARPEIWSYGHRNVQGATLHPSTGELWTAEHGAQGGDEVNTPAAGRNYGWPVITYGVDYGGAKIGEGTAKAGMEQPRHYWDPSIAPGGMAFYTGRAIPAWQGDLFVGSLKFGLVSRLDMDGDRVVREERLFEGVGGRVRDVRQGPDGFLYLLIDSSDGKILRVEPAATSSERARR